MKKYSVLPVILLWAALTAFAWFGPKGAASDTERRLLAQFPEVSAETIWNGKFMGAFETYTLDQFPLRDSFRGLKSRFHYGILGQKDNNGIYIAEGSAVKQEYPLNERSLDYALDRFNYLYDKYLSDSRIYAAIVPDKGCYLAERTGNLAMDYEALFDRMEEGMPWAAHIDLRDILSAEDYYRTDTHWRQENLLPVAEKIADAMGVTVPEFTPIKQDRPFYGVYYGQAALPLKPDTLYTMESPFLNDCVVTDHETGKKGAVYDESKLTGKDMYEVYLSGPKSLLTIENPAGIPGKELIIFRDSFGSSLAPLLIHDYAKITLIDIRYLQSGLLDRFVEFKGQDVLFLYSTLVLNNSNTMK